MAAKVFIIELLGLESVEGLTPDAKILFANKVCRALAFGLSSVILAQYLSLIGLQDHSIGLLMTCTLLGDAAVSLVVTLTADRLGRRAMLLLGAVLKLLGALIFAAGSSDLWLLLLFGATVGVISPSGNEVGPFQTLEQSILSEQTDPHKRTKLFNVYNLTGYLATAFGQMAAGVVADMMTARAGLERVDAYRVIFLAYGLLALILALLSGFCLSTACECATWKGLREEAQPPAEDVYQPLLHGTSEDSRLEDLQFENYDKPLVGAGTEAAAAEQRRAQAQIKPSLGYLTHPRWSDEGSGPSVVGGSLAANSPGSRTHPGTPTAARQIAEHNKQLCTALHNHLSLRTPSSPKKILRIAASDSSSSDPGSDLSSMDGDNVWGGTNTAQLETLKQQQRELEKYQAKPPHLQSLLTVLPESQEPCVPGLSPTSPFNSYVVDMHNSSNDDSTRDARINPFAHSQPTTQPKLISGKSLRLALGLSVLLMVDAMGAGMIPGAFVVHYLKTKYSFSQSLLGSLLSISSTVAGFAGLLAGWLSDRMGLVRTMVITHLPSSCMLLLVPFTSPAVAMSMIVARACLGRMDVGPRQSYISGIVPAHERTAALGITNILRSLGAAMGPVVTGHMATAGLWPEVFCFSGKSRCLRRWFLQGASGGFAMHRWGKGGALTPLKPLPNPPLMLLSLLCCNWNTFVKQEKLLWHGMRAQTNFTRTLMVSFPSASCCMSPPETFSFVACHHLCQFPLLHATSLAIFCRIILLLHHHPGRFPLELLITVSIDS